METTFRVTLSENTDTERFVATARLRSFLVLFLSLSLWSNVILKIVLAVFSSSKSRSTYMLSYFYYVENHLPVDNQIFGGSNLGTVAIIPASEDVPISNFSFELSLALHTIGKSRALRYIMHIHDGKMSLIQSRDRMNWIIFLKKSSVHRLRLYI